MDWPFYGAPLMNLDHLHNRDGSPLESPWFDLERFEPVSPEEEGANPEQAEREEYGEYGPLVFD